MFLLLIGKILSNLTFVSKILEDEYGERDI